MDNILLFLVLLDLYWSWTYFNSIYEKFTRIKFIKISIDLPLRRSVEYQKPKVLFKIRSLWFFQRIKRRIPVLHLYKLLCSLWMKLLILDQSILQNCKITLLVMIFLIKTDNNLLFLHAKLCKLLLDIFILYFNNILFILVNYT